ncbi:uncharacterized protein [Linepithema humile]|uniref:uncharacterized protein isoform X1 n=1 Tax=Linepithema humile TaxID=83485 RepID=UPI00351E7B6C
MLSSKANAALMRVKEMEEKYKMKRREQIWNRKEDTDSLISSVSINFSENLSTKLKESPKDVSKLKLDIKMPDIRFEGHIEEKKLSSKDKKSTKDRVSSKSEDADEVDVEILLEDKSSHSAEKQESSISDITTIQEDSLIESVLDDSMTSSKSPSYSKASQQNFSTTSNKLSGRKERIKADGKLKKGKESDKSSEISRNKLSSNNSSIAKSSKSSEKSKEKISKVRSSVRHVIDEEKNVKTLKLINSDQNSKNLNYLGSLHNDSVIKESIDTIENDSEIISELSHAEENVIINTKDSVNLSINSKYSVSENAYVMVSNSSKHPVAENDYTNDTFEDVSSLTMRSKSELQRKKIIDAENMLIKLHGDATDTTAKKEMSLEIVKSSSRTKTEFEDQNATMRKVKKEDESSHSLENDKISDHNSHEYNTKKKKRKIKNTSAKSIKASHNNIGSRKEDKALRLDEKQMRRLQKRIVELRLRQEREDLQKYLHELKDLRLQSSATPSYFSPLEFPKVAEFTQPDAIEIESKPDDQCVMLRERVSAIRRWLKDQYMLYRDYCTMAQAINAHYVPTTLDDAKKTIRELRKTTIKTR